MGQGGSVPFASWWLRLVLALLLEAPDCFVLHRPQGTARLEESRHWRRVAGRQRPVRAAYEDSGHPEHQKDPLHLHLASFL
jgi:hypothetical protein